MNAYIAVEGVYPANNTLCATKDNECTNSDGVVNSGSNIALMDKLSTIGTPITSRVSGEVDGRYGLAYSYVAERTWNGQVQPAMVRYFLKGSNQSCGLSNVMTNYSTGPSTTGNSGGGTGHTICYIHIDGPTS